jgi:hypothetical protein
MNYPETLLWGGIATVVMTAVLEGAMYLGWTRMSLPFILGTLVTADRQKAPIIGTALHLVNGYVFAFGYAFAFETIGRATWWIGLLLGAVHTSVILVLMPVIAGIHPRMATEQDGPEARAALQPPGFFALNYGRRTPLFGLLSHLVYGVIMGAFYSVG